MKRNLLRKTLTFFLFALLFSIFNPLAGAIGQASIEYIGHDGMQGSVYLPEDKSKVTDAKIEARLKELWASPNTKKILKVNGVPIAQTKWAKTYGAEKPVPKGYQDPTHHTIATITFEFIGGNKRTTTVIENRNETHTTTIENTLKSLWGQGGIRRVININGVPIEKTKFAKYAGLIQNPTVIRINNVYYHDWPTRKKGNELFIEARPFFQNWVIQADVTWDATKQSLTAVNQQGIQLVYQLNQPSLQIVSSTGQVQTQGISAPVIEEGKLLIPLQSALNAYGFKQAWEQNGLVLKLIPSAQHLQALQPSDVWFEHLNRINQQLEEK